MGILDYRGFAKKILGTSQYLMKSRTLKIIRYIYIDCLLPEDLKCIKLIKNTLNSRILYKYIQTF